MYTILKPIEESKAPKSYTKGSSVIYKEIWDKLEDIPNNMFIPIKWEDWRMAERFTSACRMKKLGKKGRPNPYANLEYRQVGEIVYIRGRKGYMEAWNGQLGDGDFVN